MLISVSTRFGVHWHHLRGAPLSCRFFETHKTIKHTLYKIAVFHTAVHAVWKTAICDLTTCGQQLLIIISCVSKNSPLNGAPGRWCEWTPKRFGAVINMWFTIHRMAHECWSVKSDTNMTHGIYSNVKVCESVYRSDLCGVYYTAYCY